jgi:hypothetical protein
VNVSDISFSEQIEICVASDQADEVDVLSIGD